MTEKPTLTKLAYLLRAGDVIVRYPDPSRPERYGQPGRWLVTRKWPNNAAGLAVVDYSEGEAIGVFVIGPTLRVTCEAPE